MTFEIHPIKKIRSLRIRELQVSSAASAFFLGVLGFAYSMPDEFVRSAPIPAPPGQPSKINVVAYIEQLTVFPIWTILFSVSAVLLVIASLRDKFGPHAHLFAGSVMTMYAVASVITAFVNPGTYIVSTTLAWAFAFAQFTIMSSYVYRHERISLELLASSEDRVKYVEEKKGIQGRER